VDSALFVLRRGFDGEPGPLRRKPLSRLRPDLEQGLPHRSPPVADPAARPEKAKKFQALGENFWRA
jgi:hypothetical protein